jgi:hypothetical protein
MYNAANRRKQQEQIRFSASLHIIDKTFQALSSSINVISICQQNKRHFSPYFFRKIFIQFLPLDRATPPSVFGCWKAIYARQKNLFCSTNSKHQSFLSDVTKYSSQIKYSCLPITDVGCSRVHHKQILIFYHIQIRYVWILSSVIYMQNISKDDDMIAITDDFSFFFNFVFFFYFSNKIP